MHIVSAAIRSDPVARPIQSHASKEEAPCGAAKSEKGMYISLMVVKIVAKKYGQAAAIPPSWSVSGCLASLYGPFSTPSTDLPCNGDFCCQPFGLLAPPAKLNFPGASHSIFPCNGDFCCQHFGLLAPCKVELRWYFLFRLDVRRKHFAKQADCDPTCPFH